MIGSLFSGIGGLELGLERAGLGSVVWQVEQDPYCRAVLAQHWPDAKRYDDVRTVVATDLRPVRVLCGGFPCQPVSLAGRRKAQADERWLWPEFVRIIGECCPAVVVVENVLGLRTAGLREVLADLADLGFDAEWCDLGAAALGAPHLRRRLFLAAAHPDRIHVRLPEGWLVRSLRTAAPRVALDDLPGCASAANADCVRRLEQAWGFAQERGWAQRCGWQFDPFARVDDGVPARLDRGRARKALGNAVVVACAEAVGRAILDACGASLQSAPATDRR